MPVCSPPLTSSTASAANRSCGRQGFRRAHAYFIEHASRLYDSKPIAGYAHGGDTGTPLGPDDFSGGDKTVAHRLGTLGFTVGNLLRPDWTYDEITLACELVKSNRWRQLDESADLVKKLSDFLILHSPRIHPGHPGIRHPDSRNPAGVARKTDNIASRHPDYRHTPSNGSHLDREVLDDFIADPDRMHAMAARIRTLLTADDGPGRNELPDLDTENISVTEGGIVLREHLRRERNPELRRKKLVDIKRRGLPIACEVCAFDFGRFYGPHGLDYIEVHHRTPLHVSSETQTKLGGLALVCSNCHRMIHHAKQWLTADAKGTSYSTGTGYSRGEPVNRQQEALRLAEELLADIELIRLSTENCILKCSRLARLMADSEAQTWLDFELHGYDKSDLAKKYAKQTGRWQPKSDDKGFWASFAKIQAFLEGERSHLAAIRGSSFSGEMILAAQQRQRDEISEAVKNISILAAVDSGLRASLYGFAMRTYHELLFSEIQAELFADVQSKVNSHLSPTSGTALSKIDTINERLQVGDDEAISHAMTTCRRLIDSVADAVYPARDGNVEVDGQPLAAKQPNILNRLSAYAYEQKASKGQRDRLRRSIGDIYGRVSKGVHSDVSPNEARFVFLQTYMLLGELLMLEPSEDSETR
jgi:5-methylcytosine-specific restriction enzyme A